MRSISIALDNGLRRLGTRGRYQHCPQSHGRSSPQSLHTNSQYMILACVSVLSALAGALLVTLFNGYSGKVDCVAHGYSNPLVPVHIVESTFIYNRSFSATISEDEDSDRFWDSLVPLGRGTVQYPERSYQFYTISAMHQLHCLWGLRQALYSASDHNNTREHDLQHIRHCIDYLRQTLICAADATLEPVDASLKGVTGWGVKRRCRSYADLGAWAEQRRASNSFGFGHD